MSKSGHDDLQLSSRISIILRNLNYGPALRKWSQAFVRTFPDVKLSLVQLQDDYKDDVHRQVLKDTRDCNVVAVPVTYRTV